MSDESDERDPTPSANSFGVFTTVSGLVCGHYDIGARIGRGAMGDVYRARDLRVGRLVAIKALPRWLRGDPESRARFKTEALAASALNHPNIVTVHELFEWQGVDLLVMEYLAGEPLNDFIPKRGLSVQRSLDIATEIATALAAAHTAGILHHDLKPGNVMILQNGHAKLVDFGLAEIFRIACQLDPTRRGRPAGTRVYMAPEKLEGQKGDTRSEIFSFGMVLYQMLTGEHPFGSAEETRVTDAIRTNPPAAIAPRVPRALALVVERCLNKNPARRYESMYPLLAELTALSRQHAPRESVSEPSVRQSARHENDGPVLLIKYDNVPESRKALAELTRQFQSGLSPAAQERFIGELKEIITTLPDFGDNPVPGPVREIRRLVMDTLRIATKGELDRCFDTHDLGFLDLYGVNLSACQLKSLSFHNCFLPTATFKNSVLTGASFEGACIRNVDFDGADLTGADFNDADWFNALNLTEAQLLTVRRGTVCQCPSSLTGMRSQLEDRYVFSFDSWPASVRNQLTAAWNKYLRPGGLGDLVARR